MKAQYLIPVMAIVLVVFVSGCVEGFEIPGFQSLFGGPTQETVEETPDIIITKDLSVIPRPPIIAGNEFTVLFTMKNQDDTQSINDVEVRLYNWGICEPLTTEFLPDPDLWSYSGGVYQRAFDEIVPNEEQVIEWAFRAPTNERIGSIEANCPMKWELNYTFSARSNDDFTVISKERKADLARADEQWEGTDNPQYIGIGPIKIYYDFKTKMPVQSNSSIQFALQVVDKGSGIYPEIRKGTMFIKVPEQWTDNIETLDELNKSCTDKFTVLIKDYAAGMVEGTDYKPIPGQTATRAAGDKVLVIEDGYVIFQNIKDINLYKRESSEIICRFKAPDLDEINIPEQSYFFSANITDYIYRLTDEETIHIKPSV